MSKNALIFGLVVAAVSATSLLIYKSVKKNKKFWLHVSEIEAGTRDPSTDPEAAAEVVKRKKIREEIARAEKARQEEIRIHNEKMATDPEYAAAYNAAIAEQRRKKEMEDEIARQVKEQVRRAKREIQNDLEWREWLRDI